MLIERRTMSFSDDPACLLDVFKDEKSLFFLDSSLANAGNGRCSYLGFDPFKIVKADNFEQLRKALKPYLGLRSNLPFPAGAVGRIGYEGNCWFGLYDGLICIDHYKKILTITSSGFPYKNSKEQKKAARQKIEDISYKISKRGSLLKTGLMAMYPQSLNIKSNVSQKQYIEAVEKALKHIHKGNIYQINLSQRMQALMKNWQSHVRPPDMYKHLRFCSPSAFSAYLDDGQTVILSSSPERFLRLENKTVQVRPMKGTRPRGENLIEDRKNRQELMDSVKENAELLMVTDLERNDLGRVCDYGSVRVKDQRTIEEYNTVFQATSTVEGRLHKKFDQFDLLKATFPSGSVTGCPKIEAMKIIGQLEKAKRELYTGALGYISFTGNMDFNVLIRTLFLEKDKISFYVGGGIVADSNPAAEYEETLVKAKAMIKALELSFKVNT